MSSKNQETLPRPEYPRPQFVRKNKWLNLNGEWGFAFDDVNVGLKEKWYREDLKNNFNKKIVVPFCFQSKLSGIGDSSFHDVIWYRRKFKIPEEFKENKILLHFGAVDYSCIVYLNEERVGSHEGGYIGFSFDITNYIQDNNLLVVRVEDPSQSLEIPRGKQYWGKELERIFYPRVSGIWQTVWLEFVSSTCFLKKMKFFPDIDKSELLVEFIIHGSDFLDKCMLLEVNFDSHSIIQEEISLDFLEKLNQKTSFLSERKLIPKTANCFKYILKIPKDLLHLWDVKNPNLYDLCISLSNKKSGELYDKIKSYFGMRKISISEINPSYNKQILLNNKPVFQKLFLVQGYWPEGFYTAPSDEYIKKDIQFIKDFGFNGLRTHQKAFDPRFLYWCDK
ncbi:MAG: glycoside hydrolase family 2 protein, partial [Promethearchaeota archaeon]